jgi:hypothetical protein
LSRLDTFIERLLAQRHLLNWAAGEIAARPGPVLELGLGNGRTFDHLREILPGRSIVVFDREARAHPLSTPPPESLILGEMRETLPAYAARNGRTAALVHADVTTGMPDADRVRLAWLPAAVAALAAADGLVLSDAALEHPALAVLDAPPELPAGRYHIYRRIG